LLGSPTIGRNEEVSARPAFCEKDIVVLQKLAERVAKIAVQTVEREKAEVWTGHNDLQPERVPVNCDPEGGWTEIIPESSLECVSEQGRAMELTLRKDIIWAELIKDDHVIDGTINVPYVGGMSDWGMQAQMVGKGGRDSYSWIAPLSDYKDAVNLRYPEVFVDKTATEERLDLMRRIFDGMLTVNLCHPWWWSLGLTVTLVYLRGLENLMLDMYEYPDELHKTMAFLRDGHIAVLDYLEDNELLTTNVGNKYIGSGGFGFTGQLPQFAAPVKLKDMWGFSESQETVAISPSMFGEFVFPYQLPILERFGLNCYGCCEPLEKRWVYIKQVPNLRRLSVSAWSDVSEMAELLQDKYVFSYKPSPVPLAMSNMDEDKARKTLQDVLEKTKGCVLELLMKDNHTLGGNPGNAYRWVQIAREECARAGRG